MDFRRAFAPLLILACGAGEELPIREARWIAPEARTEQLTTVVAPCIADFSGNPLPGAVAFEDPLLLGGQAARAGLSCASCHRGGRGNPAFIFPGVSGAPGTADVTASILSSHRGDGIFNPRPIPDLTFDAPKVSRTDSGALEAFIRALIVEEFDGAEPPPRLLASLAAYVRALDPKACRPDRPRDLIFDLARYAMALEQASAANDLGDRELTLAMLRAARSRLGQIAERYDRPGLDAEQARLGEVSAQIEAIQQRLRADARAAEVGRMIAIMRDPMMTWSHPLQRGEDRSLYKRTILEGAVGDKEFP